MKDITWGLIGCGEVTEKINGPGLYSAQHSHLAGITNRTLSRAHSWVARHGHGKVYDSVEELLAVPEIDIVYIATLPDTHMQYALMCAEAGKHCYLEKPIAQNMQEALAIKEAFAKAQKKIFVAHYRREMNRFKTIKSILDSGKIGTPLYIAVRRANPVPPGQLLPQNMPWRLANTTAGGSFFEGDIHVIDLLNYLAGPLTHVQIQAGRQTRLIPTEDIVTLSMRGKNSVAIAGLWQYVSFTFLDDIEIMGNRGLLRFPYKDNTAPIHMQTPDGTREFTPALEEHIGTPQIQVIVDELRGGPAKCSSTLDTALEAMAITCQMRAALNAPLPG